eukprot:4316453-Pleurochrysis_carterae.AAC.2
MDDRWELKSVATHDEVENARMLRADVVHTAAFRGKFINAWRAYNSPTGVSAAPKLDKASTEERGKAAHYPLASESTYASVHGLEPCAEGELRAHAPVHLHLIVPAEAAARVHAREQLWPVPPPQLGVVCSRELVHRVPEKGRTGREDQHGAVEDVVSEWRPAAACVGFDADGVSHRRGGGGGGERRMRRRDVGEAKGAEQQHVGVEVDAALLVEQRETQYVGQMRVVVRSLLRFWLGGRDPCGRGRLGEQLAQVVPVDGGAEAGGAERREEVERQRVREDSHARVWMMKKDGLQGALAHETELRLVGAPQKNEAGFGPSGRRRGGAHQRAVESAPCRWGGQASGGAAAPQRGA